MKKFKKPISIMLISGIMITNSQVLIAHADEKTDNAVNVEKQQNINKESLVSKPDIEPPVLDKSSVKVDKKEIDKKEIKSGDRVKISFKASDDITGIARTYVTYYLPGSSEFGAFRIVNINYNSNTDEWEGYIDIDENIAVGLWRLQYIFLEDKNGNREFIYNSNVKNHGEKQEDLSGGDFTVLAKQVDVTPPVLDKSSIKVDKKQIDKSEMEPGDKVKITFKASDNITGNNTKN